MQRDEIQDNPVWRGDGMQDSPLYLLEGRMQDSSLGGLQDSHVVRQGIAGESCGGLQDSLGIGGGGASLCLLPSFEKNFW